jgi:hypothetical protein
MRATSLSLVAIAAVFLGTGCEALSYYPETCVDELKCPGNNCPGACVPLPPLWFDGPVLLWIGPESEAPECPARAPKKVYEGHAGLYASHECPPCACSQPACEFPAGVTASDTTMCQGPGFTPLDTPAAWSGSCTAVSPVVPADDLRSVIIEPVTERACAPVPPDVAHDTGPIGWGVLARGCRGEAIDTVCNDPGLTCIPSADPPPPGFHQCILSIAPDEEASVECPVDYPDMHVFSRDVEDSRACTQCTCNQTAPSTCSALFSLFQGDACDPGQLLGTTAVGFGSEACAPVQLPAAELGSMAASWTTNEPGSCVASGGEATGEVKPRSPRTFCCQPPPGG